MTDAFTAAGFQIAVISEPPPPGTAARDLGFEKRDGQWLIAPYHNSPVLVPAQ